MQFRITMAALDPSAVPEFSGSAIDGTTPRATLKLIRQPMGADEDDEDDLDSDEEEHLRALISGGGSDDDSSDDEANGGPSDPAKSKKARKQANIDALKEALAGDDSDDMSVEGSKKSSKGKAVANGDEDSGSEEGSDELEEVEEFVICTLDPASVSLYFWLTCVADHANIFSTTNSHLIS